MKKIGYSIPFLLGGMLFSSQVLSENVIPRQEVNHKLHAKLPETVKAKGTLINVLDGVNPPFFIMKGTQLEGAAIDLTTALSEVLGIKIENQIVDGFSGMISGIQAGRYQLSTALIGDFPDRHEKMDFVDLISQRAAFAVNRGNPHKINSIEDTCGKRIATLAGASSEQVALKQSQVCKEQNKEPIEIQTYQDAATMLLAVRSKRADASLDSLSALSYFVHQTKDDMEISGLESENGFGKFHYQAAALPKDSPLTPIVLEAFQQIFDNGTYAAIMKKWHIEDNMIPAPGINMSKTAQDK